MKVLVLGLGAQGSAAARSLDKDPGVSELVCASHNIRAVEELVSKLTKARGVYVEAADIDSIIRAAKGMDLILNALELTYAENVLEAALKVGAHYQDYNGADSVDHVWDESEVKEGYQKKNITPSTERWWKSYMALYKVYGPRFKKIGKLALFGTGSAPGLICAATRYSMRYLDTCDTIYNLVWEGVYTKRFQPFWWSPTTAMRDMSEPGVAFENGKIVDTEPFGNPIRRKYDYMNEPVVFREHCHDEPFQYSFNADTHLKGCKNAYFKYAGTGMDFASQLYKAGLLSFEEEEFQGHRIVPFDFVVSHMPPAPRREEDIIPFIEEGLERDEGCMVVESYGKKDGRDVLVEVHVHAPGFLKSYELEGITAEMYLTGQGGYLFSKMFVNGDFDGQTGLISSDMLTDEQVDKFFEYAAELDITLETVVKKTDEVCDRS